MLRKLNTLADLQEILPSLKVKGVDGVLSGLKFSEKTAQKFKVKFGQVIITPGGKKAVVIGENDGELYFWLEDKVGVGFDPKIKRALDGYKIELTDYCVAPEVLESFFRSALVLKDDFDTHLHRAVSMGDSELVTGLIALGDNPYVWNREGENAFDLAKRKFFGNKLYATLNIHKYVLQDDDAALVDIVVHRKRYLDRSNEKPKQRFTETEYKEVWTLFKDGNLYAAQLLADIQANRMVPEHLIIGDADKLYRDLAQYNNDPYAKMQLGRHKMTKEALLGAFQVCIKDPLHKVEAKMLIENIANNKKHHLYCEANVLKAILHHNAEAWSKAETANSKTFKLFVKEVENIITAAEKEDQDTYNQILSSHDAKAFKRAQKGKVSAFGVDQFILDSVKTPIRAKMLNDVLEGRNEFLARTNIKNLMDITQAALQCYWNANKDSEVEKSKVLLKAVLKALYNCQDNSAEKETVMTELTWALNVTEGKINETALLEAFYRDINFNDPRARQCMQAIANSQSSPLKTQAQALIESKFDQQEVASSFITEAKNIIIECKERCENLHTLLGIILTTGDINLLLNLPLDELEMFANQVLSHYEARSLFSEDTKRLVNAVLAHLVARTNSQEKIDLINPEQLARLVDMMERLSLTRNALQAEIEGQILVVPVELLAPPLDQACLPPPYEKAIKSKESKEQTIAPSITNVSFFPRVPLAEPHQEEQDPEMQLLNQKTQLTGQ